MKAQVSDLFDLSSKTILVTGASQGIGLSLAEGYANAGARVYLNGRNAEKLNAEVARLSNSGVKAESAVFDVTNEQEVKKGIGSIMSKSGKIDVLVNNAGIHKRNKLEDLDIDDWNDVIRTNLTAPFLVSKYVVPEMIKAQTNLVHYWHVSH